MTNFKLEQLPQPIRTALTPGFVFLITPELCQHFPARQWSDEQILAELLQRYHEQGRFYQLANHRAVKLPNQPELTIIVP